MDGEARPRGTSIEQRFGDGIEGAIGRSDAHWRESGEAEESFRRRRSVGEAAERSEGHDVSFPAGSAVKARGWAPRAKTSTTRMRPPQRGQAGEAVGGSTWLGSAAVARWADSVAGAAARRPRTRSMLAARLGLANRP